jgi:hypothetical protein
MALTETAQSCSPKMLTLSGRQSSGQRPAGDCLLTAQPPDVFGGASAAGPGRHSVAVTWLFTTDIEGYDQCLRSQHLPSKAEKLASVRNHAYWLRTATPSHCGR